MFRVPHTSPRPHLSHSPALPCPPCYIHHDRNLATGLCTRRVAVVPLAARRQRLGGAGAGCECAAVCARPLDVRKWDDSQDDGHAAAAVGVQAGVQVWGASVGH
eukprot:356571-Chlamydomonas_euryale.AAC.1